MMLWRKLWKRVKGVFKLEEASEANERLTMRVTPSYDAAIALKAARGSCDGGGEYRRHVIVDTAVVATLPRRVLTVERRQTGGVRAVEPIEEINSSHSNTIE